MIQMINLDTEATQQQFVVIEAGKVTKQQQQLHQMTIFYLFFFSGVLQFFFVDMSNYESAETQDTNAPNVCLVAYSLNKIKRKE